MISRGWCGVPGTLLRSAWSIDRDDEVDVPCAGAMRGGFRIAGSFSQGSGSRSIAIAAMQSINTCAT